MARKNLYGKPARPFELWNIGNYETVSAGTGICRMGVRWKSPFPTV